MDVDRKQYSIDELVKVFERGLLLRNPEYQRGEAWSVVQKATFIDSVFRGYPVPALFLHKIVSEGLGGVSSERFEVVDGQQRLTALRDFRAGKFALLSVNGDSRLRLPAGVRSRPAPWAGKVFSDLPPHLAQTFLGTEITVFEIESDAHADEVRDLFIRLQAGTALSRQQIRDAWPGNLGPFIESLAGKLDRKPLIHLFKVVDKRGQRSEDEDQRDVFVSDRQFCAQLFKIFMARASDPYAYPSVSANELDAVYHEFTDFDPKGDAAGRFRTVLEQATRVFELAVKLRSDRGRSKARLLDVKAVVMFIQDVTKDPLFKLNINALAERVVESDGMGDRPAGKSTSSATLKKYYDWWRDRVAVASAVGVRLDPTRLFTNEQKATIRVRSEGLCGVCRLEVSEEDAEYDHYPRLHRDGGPTTPENGRLVHRVCHPRGRPVGS